MFHGHIFFESTAADAHKRDTVAMAGIHVGLKLEHESTEPFAQGIDHSLTAGAADRPLGHFKKSVEERAHPEVGHRRPEKHRCELTGMDQLQIQLSASSLQQIQLFNRCLEQVLFNKRLKLRIIQRQTLFSRLTPAFCPTEQDHLAGSTVDHPTKLLTTTDGPVDGPRRQLQLGFDFIKQREWVASRAIHLVDERENRNLSHPTDFEQLAGLRFEAFGCILEHHSVVRSCKRSVGVL